VSLLAPLPVEPSIETRVRVLALLQALADERRLRIVEILRGGERCVCEIQPTLGVSQPLLSHHLRVLREAGLVRDRRDGRWIHYALVPEALAEIERWLGRAEGDAAASAVAKRFDTCPPGSTP